LNRYIEIESTTNKHEIFFKKRGRLKSREEIERETKERLMMKKEHEEGAGKVSLRLLRNFDRYINVDG